MIQSRKLFSIVLICICAVVVPVRVLPMCSNSPDLATLIREYKGDRKYKGEYKNPAYGFMVRIPSPFVGYDVDDPAYQRGFTILLPHSQGLIVVYADINSLEWQNADEAARFHAETYRDRDTTAKVVTEKREKIQIGHRTAIQQTVDYLCKDDQTLFSTVIIYSFSSDKRFVYSLRWEGKATERDAGNRVLQKLTSSWRFLIPTAMLHNVEPTLRYLSYIVSVPVH